MIRILFIFALGAKAAFGIAVDWRLSRVHGLVNFAETIAGDPHRSRTLKEVFDTSANAAGSAAAVQRFKAARTRLTVSWTLPGYPASRNAEQSLEKVVLIQSAFAVDLDDFGRRLIGLLPPADLAAYLASLKELAPLYETLVWAPAEKKLQTLRDALVEQAKAKDLAALFDKAAVFYRARWPEGLPMTVALYPIPGARGHGSAESIDGFQSLGVFVDREGDGQNFGVLCHELCHSLYEAQTAAFQLEWESYFRSSAEQTAEPAYELINEALATSLGNGWVREKMGLSSSGSWYDNPHVDSFAKAIFGLVKKYVEIPRPVDKAFVQKAILALAKTMPEAARDISLRMRNTLLVTDGKVEVVRREMLRHFSVASLRVSNPLIAAVGEIKSGHSNLVVVVGSHSVASLSLVESAVTGLKLPWAALRARPGPVVFSVLYHNRPVTIIRADDDREVGEAFERLSKAKTIDAKVPLLAAPSAKT